MTEFDETEIYRIEQEFKDKVHQQYQDQRKFFFKMLVFVLLLLAIGAIAGIILSA